MSRWAFLATHGRRDRPGQRSRDAGATSRQGSLQRDAHPRSEPVSLEALAESLMVLTPRVSVAPQGVWLEIGGSVSLLGSESAIAREALSIAERLHHRGATIAVADQAEAARLLALGRASSIFLVSPGHDAEALSSLALEVLALPDTVTAYLHGLGLQSLGDLARLSPTAMRQRLGPEGERAVLLARGAPLPPPSRYVPPPRPEASRQCEPPVPPGEALLFLLKAALDELTARLAGRGLAVERLRLVLRFEGGRRREEELLLPRAQTTTEPLLALLRERVLSPPVERGRSPQRQGDDAEIQIDQWPDRVVEVAVQTLQATPRAHAQLSLLGREEQEEQELEALLTRLGATLGSEAVFAAQLVPVHRPEASWRPVEYGRDAPPPLPVPHKRPDQIHGEEEPEPLPPRPILLLARPRPLVGSLSPGQELLLRNGQGVPILGVWGPERIQSEWWTPRPLERDYYVVDLEGGHRIWVFEDLESGELFLHGVFD